MKSRASRLLEMALKKKQEMEQSSDAPEGLSRPQPDSSVEQSSDYPEHIGPQPGCSTWNISPVKEVDEDLESVKDFEPSISSYYPSNASETDIENGMDSICLMSEHFKLIFMHFHYLAEGLAGETIPKRRKLNAEGWKRNVRKLKRAKGEAYVDIKGRLHPARTLLPSPCNGKTNHIGCNEISEEEREILYSEFRSLCDIDSQRHYVHHLIEKKPKGRSTIDGPSRRKLTLTYSFVVKGVKILVCRKFFMCTLNVTDALIRSATIRKVNDYGRLETDERGRHEPHNKLSSAAEQFIKSHIESFPAVESHYCRKSSKKRYLDCSLNVNIMHCMYKEACDGKQIQVASLSKYRQVFKSYNLGFFKPKKDQCKTCLAFRSLSGEEKEERTEHYERHMKRKEMARRERDFDKAVAQGNSETLAFNFDLQAVLTTPKGAAGEIFYLRKLAVYNLTIYNLGNQDVECCLWDETQGKRGANEISSCIFSYLFSKTSITSVRMMSDSCGGQQKNSAFSAMCLYSVQNHPTLNSIVHKFFEPGHTEMECDSIHSKIESKSKYSPIYIPEGWAQMIRVARINPKPYKLVQYTFDDILDFKGVAANYKIGKNLPWKKVCWLEYRKCAPNKIYFKTSYDEELSVADVSIKRRRNVPKVQKAYKQALPISLAKYKDLMKMCDDLTIPKSYHNFYKNIKFSPNARDCLPQPNEDEDSEDDF